MMANERKIQQLRLQHRQNNENEGKERKKKEQGDFGGRRAVLVLFFFTVALSLFFWLKRNIASWLLDFFGPSTWTFSK